MDQFSAARRGRLQRTAMNENRAEPGSWEVEDVDIPDSLAELLSVPPPAPPVAASGSTSGTSRRTLAQISRSFVTDYINSAAHLREIAEGRPTRLSNGLRDREPPSTAIASDSDERGILTLDQLLGPTPRPDTAPPRRSEVIERLRLTSANRTPMPVLGMSWPNATIDRTPSITAAQTAAGSQPATGDSNAVAAPAENASDPTASAVSRTSPSTRARRTILQDTAPRPRTHVSGPSEVIPSGSHYSWASYGTNREAGPSAARNVISINGTGTESSSTATDIPAPVTATPNTQQPVPNASTDSIDNAAAVRPTEGTSTRNERMATTILRRRRQDGNTMTRTRVIYGFDPTDIEPPGGADDHIWSPLGDPDDSDDETRWGVFYTRGQAAGDDVNVWDTLDPSHLDDWGARVDGWGVAPETGASLSRGRFNRRRRSFRASRDGAEADSAPAADGDEFRIDFTSRLQSARRPTNADSIALVRPPIIVQGEGSTRPRPDDDDDEMGGETAERASKFKRRKRDNPSTLAFEPSRPSYLSYTSLPETAVLPYAFETPDSTSTLTVSVIESKDMPPRPVVSVLPGTPLKGSMADACSILTTTPIPPGIGVHYFEAEVLSWGEQGYISVGWIHNQLEFRRLVGWDPGTWGWHCDDGKVFNQDGSSGTDFSEPWTVGDIVGFGLDFAQRRAFLTKNGKLLGSAFRQLPTSGLYPAVGLQSVGESVAVNFSGPFQFDIDDYVRTKRDEVVGALARPKVSFFEMPGGASALNGVPRIAGLTEECSDDNASTKKPRDDKGESSAYGPAALPAGSPLVDDSRRAQAAWVLDHLATNGHSRALAMLKESMLSRGWITGNPSPVLSVPDVDSPMSEYPTPAAAILALTRTLESDGTPHMPLRLIESLGSLGKNIERRIHVYEFAAKAGDSASDMDVDDSETDMDSVLAAGRELRRRAMAESWAVADVTLLDHASAILASGGAAQLSILALKEARVRDAAEVEQVLKTRYGIKRKSCLHAAIAQTALVHDVLVSQHNDAEAPYISLKDVLGK